MPSLSKRFTRSVLVPSVLALLGSIVGCGANASAAEEPESEVGTTASAVAAPGTVFAPIPNPPGHPEGIVVVGDDVFVAGPAVNGTAGLPASRVLVFDRLTGASKGDIPIVGENLAAEHALSCITSDASGRLYVIATQLGVVRLTRSGSTWTQSIYSPPLPDLLACSIFGPSPCSPTVDQGLPLPNDLAFDPAGNLYITDSHQATIFRVPPGGGANQIWYQSSRLAGIPGQIGLNGVRVSPDGTRLFVTVTLPLLTPLTGTLYSLPIVNAPTEWDMRRERFFPILDGPDGIAFGQNGEMYVALASGNGVAVLNSAFQEVTRYTGPAGSAIPYDGPANIAFDGAGAMLVTNHAPLTQNPASFAVLKTVVGDNGSPLFKP